MTASARTRRRFKFAGDIWSIVEAWAKENKYSKMAGSTATNRTYRTGGWIMTPVYVQISKIGEQEFEFSSWVTFLKLTIARDIPLDLDGGFVLPPRAMAKPKVNRLLVQLGQQPMPNFSIYFKKRLTAQVIMLACAIGWELLFSLRARLAATDLVILVSLWFIFLYSAGIAFKSHPNIPKANPRLKLVVRVFCVILTAAMAFKLYRAHRI
jgi:hypothetical protein